jgi:hypothetical protein
VIVLLGAINGVPASARPISQARCKAVVVELEEMETFGFSRAGDASIFWMTGAVYQLESPTLAVSE